MRFIIIIKTLNKSKYFGKFFLSYGSHINYCKSSSHFGMSKISANRGGNRMLLQFFLNHSKCDECLQPSTFSSKILASSAGIICSAFTAFGRERMICTRSASAMHSLVFNITFFSVTPGRSVSRIRAEYRPSSISLKQQLFSPFTKLNREST